MFLKLEAHKGRSEQMVSSRYICQVLVDRIVFHNDIQISLFPGEYWSIIRALSTRNKVKFVDIEMDTPTDMPAQVGTSDQHEKSDSL